MPPIRTPRARKYHTSKSSASSKATLAHPRRNGSQNGPSKRPIFSADPSTDLEKTDAEALPPPKLQNYIIGVDFGTTFSSIAYYPYSTDEEKIAVRASGIKIITNWPGDEDNNGRSEQVPMEIWYSPEPIKRDPIQGVQFDHDAKGEIVGSKLRSVRFDEEAEEAALGQLNLGAKTRIY